MSISPGSRLLSEFADWGTNYLFIRFRMNHAIAEQWWLLLIRSTASVHFLITNSSVTLTTSRFFAHFVRTVVSCQIFDNVQNVQLFLIKSAFFCCCFGRVFAQFDTPIKGAICPMYTNVPFGFYTSLTSIKFIYMLYNIHRAREFKL